MSNIMEFKSWEAEAEVMGKVTYVDWHGRSLTIHNVNSMRDAVAIIEKLSAGGVAAEHDDTINSMAFKKSPVEVAAQQEVAKAKETLAEDVAAGRIPPTPPTTRPIVMPLEAANPAPKADIAQAASVPSALPAGSTASSEDYSIFGAFTKIGEVVVEIRKRGNDDYPSILAFCNKLAELGDVCPVVDQLVKEKRMEERLKVHAAGKGIRGVPV